MIPPKPHAAKYFPLYSSILGFGSVFSSIDILATLFQVPSLNCTDRVELLSRRAVNYGFDMENDRFPSQGFN
jgi:hypothetical protein